MARKESLCSHKKGKAAFSFVVEKRMHFCKRELQAAGETLQFELSNLVTLNDIISHYQIRAQATSPSRLILETEQTFLIP